jgi:hypothetical protein
MGKSSSSSSSSSEEKDKKKEKKVKTKSVVCSPSTFTKRYENYYNSKKLTDYKLKFESNGEEVEGHKIVFASNSEGSLYLIFSF